MLTVRHLAKAYSRSGNRVTGAADVSFDVPDGTFFTLLGPSGCGKTTTLRSIAGLERPDEGDIQIGSNLVFSSSQHVFVPPHRRKLGMVFQSYAIWPHMTVAQNVSYPLDVRRLPRQRIRDEVSRVLKMVDMAGLEERPATDLSGGQQQRVAVARAIVGEADVLLFDEPLSNIDTRLRVQMREELRELQRRLAITAVYVTHDQEEALAISDIIAVMDAGRIVETGSPSDLYMRPSRRFTANFIGRSNLLPAVLERVNGTYAQASTSLGAFTCLKGPAQAGQQVHLCVRPEDVEIVTGGERDNTLEGTVASVSFLGAFADCRVRAGAETIELRLHPRKLLTPGDAVRLQLPRDACYAVVD